MLSVLCKKTTYNLSKTVLLAVVHEEVPEKKNIYIYNCFKFAISMQGSVFRIGNRVYVYINSIDIESDTDRHVQSIDNQQGCLMITIA